MNQDSESQPIGEELLPRNREESKARSGSVFGAPPVGSVVAFAGMVSQEMEQEGWMLCDGRALSRNDFQELWEVLQTIYGNGVDAQGAQTGDFNIPDYRGGFLRGVDNNSHNDPDAARRLSPDGSNTIVGDVVGSRQPHSLRSHDHPARGIMRASEPLSVLNLNSSLTEMKSGLAGGGAFSDAGQNGISRRQRDVDVTISSTGDNETRPLNTSVNWLIKSKP
jgi:rhizosphere induced protein